jgi:membrane protein YqaA with SNARE-associated domain
LKQLFARIVAKWKLVLLPAMAKLGLWGIGALTMLDSSSIPIPIDAVIALYVWDHKSSFWLCSVVAAAGSAIGGLVPYGVGRAGGEMFLLKRIDRQRFEQMRARFERQEFLAMMIPSMLPPPTPWKAFVFAAGVFEMRVPPFLLAVFCGRTIRWLALSLLVLKLGPGAVDVIARHSVVVVAVVSVLAPAGLAVWWFSKKRTTSSPIN